MVDNDILSGEEITDYESDYSEPPELNTEQDSYLDIVADPNRGPDADGDQEEKKGMLAGGSLQEGSVNKTTEAEVVVAIEGQLEAEQAESEVEPNLVQKTDLNDVNITTSRLFGTNELEQFTAGYKSVLVREDGSVFGGGGMTIGDLLADIESEAPEVNNVPPLSMSAAVGDVEAVKFALAEGADPNSQDQQGRTPLHFATLSKSDKCAAALLVAGAQCNLTDVDGRNPVHWAAYRCCPKLLKLMLLNSRESVLIQDKEGRIPLHWSVVVGKAGAKGVQIITKSHKALMESLDVPDTDAMTPLHWASFHNNPKACELLLRNGASAKVVDVDGKSPLHWVVGSSNALCVRVLTKYDKDAINGRDAGMRTALHLSVSENKPDIVSALVNVSGCDVDAQDDTGRTPLHWAAGLNHHICAQILLRAQCNNKILDVDGAAPVHYAAQHDFMETVKLLSDSLNLFDQNGATPLMWAAASGNDLAVADLLQFGATCDTVDASGRTALHIAAFGGNSKCVALLLDVQPDFISAADSNGQTALFSASSEGQTDAVNLLLSRGADATIIDTDKRNAAHWAAINGHLEPLHLVATAAIETLSTADDRGETVLHYASFFGRLEIIQYLIEAGVDLNDADREGITALHWAALKGNKEIVQRLCEAGAYPNAMEINGNKSTPWDYANGGEFTDCCEILASFGGVDYGLLCYYAALIIQTSWRSFKARKHAAAMRAQYGVEYDSRMQAATVIGSMYRGYIVRKRMEEDRKLKLIVKHKKNALEGTDESKHAQNTKTRVREEVNKRKEAESAAQRNLKRQERQSSSNIKALAITTREAEAKRKEIINEGERDRRQSKNDIMVTKTKAKSELAAADALKQKREKLEARAKRKEIESIRRISRTSPGKDSRKPSLVPPPRKVPSSFLRPETADEFNVDNAVANVEAHDLRAELLKSQQFVVRAEKSRIGAVRTKIHAARVIQRAYRRYRQRVPYVKHSNALTRRGSLPSIVTVKPALAATSKTNRRTLVTSMPPVLRTTERRPTATPMTPVERLSHNVLSIHKGYATFPMFPTVKHPPKQTKTARLRATLAAKRRAQKKIVKPELNLRNLPHPDQDPYEEGHADKQSQIQREIAALTIQLWWRKHLGLKRDQKFQLIHHSFGPAHEVRQQTSRVTSIYLNSKDSIQLPRIPNRKFRGPPRNEKPLGLREPSLNLKIYKPRISPVAPHQMRRSLSSIHT